jgi:hypothetical protein
MGLDPRKAGVTKIKLDEVSVPSSSSFRRLATASVQKHRFETLITSAAPGRSAR